MRIAGIGVAVPSRVVTNDDIVQTVARGRPRDRSSDTIARSLTSLLEATGAVTRHHRAPGELVRDLTRVAMQRSLAPGELRSQDIDLVIHCSIGRGFLEPGNAYFCANLLGMQCDCFDVSDACMGWLRAANLACDAIAAGRYRRVMVVSTEFSARHLLESSRQIESPLELRRLFTAFTLGEVAVATVFEASDDVWSFRYRSRPDLADLCTVPLPGHAEFAAESPRLAHLRPLQLDVHAGELFSAADDALYELLSETVRDLDGPDLYVPHTASSVQSLAIARRVGMPQEKIFASIMPRFGNVASASLPLGLFHAQREGVLAPNADVVLCPASAGVSVGVSRFRWNSGAVHVAG